MITFTIRSVLPINDRHEHQDRISPPDMGFEEVKDIAQHRLHGVQLSKRGRLFRALRRSPKGLGVGDRDCKCKRCFNQESEASAKSCIELLLRYIGSGDSERPRRRCGLSQAGLEQMVAQSQGNAN